MITGLLQRYFDCGLTIDYNIQRWSSVELAYKLKIMTLSPGDGVIQIDQIDVLPCCNV